VVELLLTKGADVNSKTNEGGTALHEGKLFFVVNKSSLNLVFFNSL
jgi:hypothetical protein